jgi:hypothetical protein
MPTFQNLRRGNRSISAIPGKKFGAAKSNFADMLKVSSKPFRSKSFSTLNATITGITKDSTGAALGICTVQLFRTLDDSFRSEVLSDASGNYVLYPDVTGPFYIVAYKAGAPDVAGTTMNTLIPA